ncbi:hypothetical protein MSAN_00149600 [Mycena sanguinolenta]|uniref:Uncharacterized protein n=1 Tax=Mycena sanguinolenta TaxID=230812 RepID=A0A8H7DM07_9AGAR|nr:hypothetical protein MSAN_00149600 [Mycena sanguinolenta]
MRRIRGGPVLQPFIDDRPPADPALAGNVFATGPFATSSNATAGAAGASDACEGTSTFLAVGAATTAVRRYPAEKTQEMGYTNTYSQAGPSGQVSRQPSQSTQADISPLDTQLPLSEKRRETESPSGTQTSARERYLEQRLATLEAHVAAYLPPPYEQPES